MPMSQLGRILTPNDKSAPPPPATAFKGRLGIEASDFLMLKVLPFFSLTCPYFSRNTAEEGVGMRLLRRFF